MCARVEAGGRGRRAWAQSKHTAAHTAGELTLGAVGSLPRGVARAAIIGAALAVAGALVGAARRGGRDEGSEEQEFERHGTSAW